MKQQEKRWKPEHSQIYIDKAYDGQQEIHLYSTGPDRDLFKLISKLEGFRYHKKLKRIVSPAREEYLHRLEYAVGPKVRINTFALRKKLFLAGQAGGDLKPQIPDYRYQDVLPFMWIQEVKKEGKQYYMLETDSINQLKKILAQATYIHIQLD